MNPHVVAIRSALEDFCRAYTSDGDEWHLDVRPSGVADNVHAVIVHPMFRGMDLFERQRHISDFLESRLAMEHLVHLSLRRALSPEEFEDAEAAERAARASVSAFWPGRPLSAEWP